MKNKFLKRVLSVLLCLCVFCSSFTLTAFAVVPAWAIAVGSYLLEKAADAAFDALLNSAANDYESNFKLKSTFIAYMRDYAATNKLTYDDVLDYIGFLVADWDSSNIDIYGENASEVWNKYHNALYKCCYVYFNTDIAQLAKEITDPAVKAPTVTDDGKVQVPVKDFKELVDEGNYKYYPKNATGKVSFRTDKRYNTYYKDLHSSVYRYNEWDFYSSAHGGFFPVGGGNDMYILMFYKTDTKTYYSPVQFHFKITTEDVWYQDRDEVEYTNYTLSCEYWDCFASDQSKALKTDVFTTADYTYIALYFSGDYLKFNTYANFQAYNGFNNSSRKDFSISTDIADYHLFLDSSDTYQTIKFGGTLLKHFYPQHETSTNGCEFNGQCDVGYIASATPIEHKYRIDTTKIPDNYYITIGGDTVYDYSITNPETGQSDTVNNYITNNYTYVTNNDQGGSGNGGGVGGNVTVGGKIDVGGSVGVDINVNVPPIDININGNGGGGGNSGDNIGDYVDTSGATSDIGDVITKIPKLAKGFTDYLKDFFSWLPPEIYSLIIAVLVVTIWRAIIKR